MKNVIFPPEWARQEFVQLTFPHQNTDWAYMLDEVCGCFCAIINAILQYENVVVVCADKESETKLKTLKNNIKTNYQLSIVNCQSNDTWARDHAGITVSVDGKMTVLDFCFNGWGKKFEASLDNQITSKIFQNPILNSQPTVCVSKFSIFNYRNCRDFVLEGGSIETDGAGTLLTTEKCLLSENRNHLSKSKIEEKLKDFLGIKRVLWLQNGALAGDDTDSHIDTLARLCPNNTITYVSCNDQKDEHFAELKAMEEELRNFRTLSGQSYTLVPLPLPDAVFDTDGNRLPATYANFLIINNAILVPIYHSSKDEIACRTLQTVFPDRAIVPVNCLPLIEQHGSLHCVTMQFPAQNALV